MIVGGGVLSIVGTVMAFSPLGAIGLIVGIVGGVIAMLGGFFKSKDQKRREAVQKISSSLSSQLQQQKIKTIEQLRNSFNEY